MLNQRVQLFSRYLKEVGVQAEHVLLMHENNTAARQLRNQIHQRSPDLDFRLDKESHQLWTLTPTESRWLEEFAQEEPQFHLADGHHRYTSTLHTKEASFLFSFLVAKDQLINQAFTWAIKDKPMAKKLLANLPKERFCSKEEANIAIRFNHTIIHCRVHGAQTVTNYILETLLAIPPEQAINLSAFMDYYPPQELTTEKTENYALTIDYTPLSIDK